MAEEPFVSQDLFLRAPGHKKEARPQQSPDAEYQWESQEFLAHPFHSCTATPMVLGIREDAASECSHSLGTARNTSQNSVRIFSTCLPPVSSDRLSRGLFKEISVSFQSQTGRSSSVGCIYPFPIGNRIAKEASVSVPCQPRWKSPHLISQPCFPLRATFHRAVNLPGPPVISTLQTWCSKGALESGEMVW